MRSTFMGLETSKRGLYTQQSALYTTGHNISNANTLGYSRQRVNMEATAGFPGTGLNAGTMPGFLGTGVEAGSIQRIRDGFVDKQYRDESTKLGYWGARTDAISQMEDVLAEPSKYGLQQSFSDFWQALQTLAANPENGGARAVVVERGVSIADSFNYINKSLEDIQTNLGTEIGVTTKNVNSLLKQIGELNRQIAEVEPNGYLPNDLYDARDNLLDELSAIVPIEVSYEKTGGRAPAMADGTVTVKIKTNGDPITVVQKGSYSELKPVGNEGTDSEGNPVGPMTGFTITNGPQEKTNLNINDMQKTGSLKSLATSYGYIDSSQNKAGLYPDMLAELDKMAKAFIDAFNDAHNDVEPAPNPPVKFFEGEDAASIKVSGAIQEDPGKINASSVEGETGNGANAKNMGDVLFDKLPALDNVSIQSYYSGLIGELGVEGQQAVKMTENSVILLGAVSNRRDSISSVSLDEEMTDMIRFQQAYNASARMVTVMDETLEKIINGMGLVGR